MISNHWSKDLQAAYKNVRQFVHTKHAGQTHANNVPVWHHLERVSSGLNFLLDHFQEESVGQRVLVVTSALGHDLLEDTDATREEIEQVFGTKGYELILGMTNEWGDHNVAPYVQKVSSGSEEVRLIKLSDLRDNLSSVTYNIASLTPDWVADTFLPIVVPMVEAVVPTRFTRYPLTGEFLKLAVGAAIVGLNEELERFNRVNN